MSRRFDPRIRLATFGLLTLTISCNTARPHFRIESSYGVVRSESPEVGRAIARSMEVLIPRIASLLPNTAPVRPQVWVQKKLRLNTLDSLPEQIQGFNTSTRGRIHLLETGNSIHFTLAHELTHAMLGPSWDPLPGVIEEGLCEWVATRVDRKRLLKEQSLRLFQSALYLGSLTGRVFFEHRKSTGSQFRGSATIQFSLSEASSKSPLEALSLAGGYEDLVSGDLRGVHYSYGFWIVLRTVNINGVMSLHDLCLRAEQEDLGQIPVDWILDAAQLPDDPRTWQSLILEELHAPELREIAADIRADLAETLNQAVRPMLEPGLTGHGFLKSSTVTFQLDGHPTRIKLSEIPEFGSALVEVWR